MNSFIEEVELFLAEYHLSYADIKEEKDRVVVYSLADYYFDSEDVSSASMFVNSQMFEGVGLSSDSSKMIFVKRR